MRRWRFAVVVLAFSMISGALARADDETFLAIREDDAGKTVNLNDQSGAMIFLKGNPTTGYRWTLAGIDGKSLALEGEVVYLKEDPGPPGIAGRGGVFGATFRPKEAGTSKITLEYKRPWEKDKPAAKTFTVTVVVKAPATKPTTQPTTKPTTKPATLPAK